MWGKTKVAEANYYKDYVLLLVTSTLGISATLVFVVRYFGSETLINKLLLTSFKGFPKYLLDTQSSQRVIIDSSFVTFDTFIKTFVN